MNAMNFYSHICGDPGAFFLSEDGPKKPGFPLQVLGFAAANPVGFPLQSLARAPAANPVP
jgi:hypothetical protein